MAVFMWALHLSKSTFLLLFALMDTKNFESWILNSKNKPLCAWTLPSKWANQNIKQWNTSADWLSVAHKGYMCIADWAQPAPSPARSRSCISVSPMTANIWCKIGSLTHLPFSATHDAFHLYGFHDLILYAHSRCVRVTSCVFQEKRGGKKRKISHFEHRFLT